MSRSRGKGRGRQRRAPPTGNNRRLGDFAKHGLFLFTVRNGLPENWNTRQGKLYAEKLMIVDEGQITPLHFH